MKAGFAKIDITPPLGCLLQGCFIEIIADKVEVPLYARAAIFDSGVNRAAIIQLDFLSIRWTQTNNIRAGIEKRYGFPGKNIMVAAIHNHCGPAVANIADLPRDETYINSMTEKVIVMFGEALQNMQDAELGLDSILEWDISTNRRIVQRDGSAMSYSRAARMDPLFIEGPVDPEVAVLAVKGKAGKLLGVIVNFATHPNIYSGTSINAGVPGLLGCEMQNAGCPITIFLNGAAGNLQIVGIIKERPQEKPSEELARKLTQELAKKLAQDISLALKRMTFKKEINVSSISKTVKLPFRKITPDEINGTVKGAQRYGPPGLYDRVIPGTIRLIKERKYNLAEVQAVRLGDYVYVSIPGEPFVELGLLIKEKSHPRHVVVVGYANGMVGYVPTREAFLRGGYETTFTSSSRLDPEAGYILVNTAVELAGSVGD